MSGDVYVPELFDVIGIAAGALDGALFSATRTRPTIVGVAIFGFVTTFGGAMIRDALIGRGPTSMLSDPLLLGWVAAIGLAGLFVRFNRRLGSALAIMDALYLPIWVVAGTDKAIHNGFGVLSILVLGVITGIGGGVLRDVLARETPVILRDGPGYAVAALACSALFLALHSEPNTSREVDALITVAVVFAFRLGCLRFGWLSDVPGRRDREQLRSQPAEVED